MRHITDQTRRAFTDRDPAVLVVGASGPSADAYQFPKTLEPLSVLSFWDPATDPFPVRDTVVHYRIGQFRGTWGRFPIRVGWSAPSVNPADDALQQYVTYDVLKMFMDREHERVVAEHHGPVEILDPGTGVRVFCNAELVMHPDQLLHGRCRTCQWKTAETRNFNALDELLRGHNEEASEYLQRVAKEAAIGRARNVMVLMRLAEPLPDQQRQHMHSEAVP